MQQCPIEGEYFVRKHCTFYGDSTESYYKFKCIIAIKVIKTCFIATSDSMILLMLFTKSYLIVHTLKEEKIDLI